ncbi:MAG: phosphoglycerate kinase, partial [Rhizobiaceae bacterium]|nr:phosphoglycerate kinase [Rhizobiaceae bacterium]
MNNRFNTLDDVNVAGKRVLVRVDLNVPMDGTRVTDTTRLQRITPPINEIANNGGKVMLLAHFGRPQGNIDAQMSLAQ